MALHFIVGQLDKISASLATLDSRMSSAERSIATLAISSGSHAPSAQAAKETTS
jgi:hypothetical protein